MHLIDWLTKRKKPLSQMTRSELRRQELLLEKERMRLLNRVNKLAKDKEQLFQRGAAERTPEIRRALAQEFELKTTEQLLAARQLNIRSKEMLTVSRLRMLRQNAEQARGAGKLGLVSDTDLVKLSRLIENDSIRSEAYQERLDEILSAGAAMDEGTDGLSESGRAVMGVWDKMDAGIIGDATEGFDEADRRVREKQSAAEA